MINWSDYEPYFRESEFRCKHSGKCEMDKEFMDKLLALRLAFAEPMTITSGYRDKTHPIEAKKATTGAHTTGKACDIAVQGKDAYRLLKLALAQGFTGIGIQQKGSGRFIHLDTCADSPSMPRPAVWSY
jgi:uncharacterized protein YcbK (DUF882 family)